MGAGCQDGGRSARGVPALLAGTSGHGPPNLVAGLSQRFMLKGYGLFHPAYNGVVPHTSAEAFLVAHPRSTG